MTGETKRNHARNAGFIRMPDNANKATTIIVAGMMPMD